MGKVSVLIRRKENVFQILIVEDDKELSQLFQKELEKNGYQAVSYKNQTLPTSELVYIIEVGGFLKTKKRKIHRWRRH